MAQNSKAPGRLSAVKCRCRLEGADPYWVQTILNQLGKETLEQIAFGQKKPDNKDEIPSNLVKNLSKE